MIGKPLHEIKDDAQLDYVLEAIDEIDYNLATFQFKVTYLFENATEAHDALFHLRALIANFVRTGLGVIDGSESVEDDE